MAIKDSFFEYATKDKNELLKELNTNLNYGLNTDYVELWQDENGFNELNTEENYIWYKALFESFFNPFNIVLSILSLISFITYDIMTGITILSLIIVSTLIKFIQENNTNKAGEKLKSMIKTTATTLRDGKKKEQ